PPPAAPEPANKPLAPCNAPSTWGRAPGSGAGAVAPGPGAPPVEGAVSTGAPTGAAGAEPAGAAGPIGCTGGGGATPPAGAGAGAGGGGGAGAGAGANGFQNPPVLNPGRASFGICLAFNAENS